MATLAEMVVRIGADATRLKRGLASASADVNRFAKRTDNAGLAMQRFGKSSLKGGLAVGVGLGFAIKTGMRFDKTMSTVRAATQASDRDFQKLRQAALKWGSSTQFSATQVAEAMVEMGKAGFKTKETLAALPGVLSAAAASGESMATVSNIMVNTLTGFGKGASYAVHVSDALALSANETTASIADFGEALKYVAPVAKSAGVSFDETNGALIALAKVGIQGSMAGTSLRGVLQSMIAPNKRVTEMMKQAGVSFRDANGNMLPLSKNIDNLKKALAGMSKSEADKFLARMFGRENISAAQAFLDIGGKGLRQFEKQSRLSGGSAAKFAAVLRDNLNGDLEQMSGAAETAAIKIADDLTPALRDLTREATKLIDKFNELDPGTRKSVSQLIAATAVFLTFAGVVGVVGGAVVRGVGIMSKAFTPLVAALKWLGPKFKFALFAIRYFVTTSGGLLSSLGRIGRIAFSPIMSAVRVLVPIFQWVAAGIAAAVTAIAAVLGIPVWVVAAVVAAIVAAAIAIVVKWDWVKAQTARAWNATVGFVKSAGQGIVDGVRWVGEQVSALWDKLTSLTIGKVAHAFGYAVGYALGTLVKLVIQGAQAIGRFAVALGQGAARAVTAFVNWIRQLPGRLMAALRSAVSAAIDFAGNLASAIADGASAAVSAFVGFMQALPGHAASIGRSVVSGLIGAIRALPGKVGSLIASVGSAISGAAQALYNAAVSVGQAIIDGIVAGIKAGAGAIKDAAVNAAKGALDGAKDALGIKSPSKEARDQIGLPFAQGIAAGITAGGDGAVQAAANVAQRVLDRARAASDAAASRQALRAARKTKEKGDDRDALLAIKMAKLEARAARAQLAVDRLSIAVQRFQTADTLAAASYSLGVTLNGGVASMQMQQDRISSLKKQYESLAKFLQKNAKKLSADTRAGILQQLQGLAQEMNDIQQSIADAAKQKVADAMTGVGQTNRLIDAQYALAVALNGGTASYAQQQQRLADLAAEYARVQGFMNTNALDVEQQTSLLGDLASIASEMNQIREDIKTANEGTTSTTGGSTGGGSTSTGQTIQALTTRDGTGRIVVHQNFIGPNVDHFTASRDALFAYQTAGLAPA